MVNTVTIKGGQKLENALARIARKLDRTGTLQVGYFAGATYPTGVSVPMVAAIQNFGAPSRGIPPRPFFSNAVAKNKRNWPKEIKDKLVATNYDTAETLNYIGERIVGEVQESITSGHFVKLKPATIARKGFDTPLIDTGRMLQSVSKRIV